MNIDDLGFLNRAKQIKSEHFNARPCSPDLIVIHNITLPPKQFGSEYIEALFLGELNPEIHPYFQSIFQLKVSAHFYIGRDGEIIQFVSTENRAWHAGISRFLERDSCNDFSIGIELNGYDHYPYTFRQYQSLAQLTEALFIRYPHISAITGHEYIAPERKTDPSPSFNWLYYQKLLKNPPQFYF